MHCLVCGNQVEQSAMMPGDDYQLLKSIKLPDADNVRYDAVKDLIYVAHAENSLSAIDPKTYEMKAMIKLPGPPEAFQIDSKRSRIYVNTLKPAQVAVIDSAKNEVIANFPLKLAGANYPMALDAKNEQLFIGCRKPSRIRLACASAFAASAASPGADPGAGRSSPEIARAMLPAAALAS